MQYQLSAVVLGGAYGYGTVFSIPVNGGSPTVLASFNFSNGANPRGGLTLSGNTLYGTTEMGGNLSVNGGNGDGTVFSVPLSGGSPMVLASFNGTDGSFPAAALTLSGGTLYGTTDQGGAGNDGTGSRSTPGARRGVKLNGTSRFCHAPAKKSIPQEISNSW